MRPRLSLPGRPTLAPPTTGVPALIRLAAISTARVSGWAIQTTVNTATDIARQVAAGEAVTDIMDRQISSARLTIARALDLPDRSRPLTATTIRILREDPTPAQLREQGDALLRQVGDAGVQTPTAHPAFPRLLRELLPDEARILRFLALAGPQPAIDIRVKAPRRADASLLAAGISMVADMAGCTHPDRDQQYLANLGRLGMLAVCDDQVKDPRRYSLIEAQPEATAAMAKARRTSTIYRSITITDFGRQFCAACFTLDGYDAGGWLTDAR